jgi:hypothetical protein
MSKVEKPTNLCATQRSGWITGLGDAGRYHIRKHHRIVYGILVVSLASAMQLQFMLGLITMMCQGSFVTRILLKNANSIP